MNLTSTATSRRVVIFSAAGVAVILVAANVSKGQAPKGREVLGAGVAFTGLGLAADVVPALASPLALLVLAAVSLTKGADALHNISGLVRTGPRPGNPSQASGSPAAPGTTVQGTGPFTSGTGCTVLHGIPISAKYGGQAAAIESRFGVKLTSGFRSQLSQAILDPGVKTSDHLCGYAGDFAGSKPRMDALAAWAKTQPFAVVVYRGRYYIPAGGSGPWSDHYDHVHISFERCNGKVGCT